MRIAFVGTRGIPASYSGFETCVEQLGQRLVQRGHEVTVLHLFAREDASPALAGPMLLKQAEKQTQFSADINDDLLASYRTRWAAFQRGCESACLARESIYVSACTDTPFDELILNSLRRAGVLGG